MIIYKPSMYQSRYLVTHKHECTEYVHSLNQLQSLVLSNCYLRQGSTVEG